MATAATGNKFVQTTCLFLNSAVALLSGYNQSPPKVRPPASSQWNFWRV